MPTLDEVMRFEPPAARLLGRKVVSIDSERGAVTVQFVAQPEFLNRHGTVQGGLLSAMLDSATALALYAVLPPELTAVTMTLNVTFLRPGKEGSFTATSELVERDDRDATTRGKLFNAEGQLVAAATATLRISKRKI